jgi:hypothetical protein
MKTERVYETGPGFVRAKECPDCGHTKCGEDCNCNCDAAKAEHEVAELRVQLENMQKAVIGNGHVLSVEERHSTTIVTLSVPNGGGCFMPRQWLTLSFKK